ncbi:hypothetical protein Bhyg_09841, partial [Pseudolycoriella hygida]
RQFSLHKSTRRPRTQKIFSVLFLKPRESLRIYRNSESSKDMIFYDETALVEALSGVNDLELHVEILTKF